MVFIDVHCHVDMCKDKAENIVERARKSGVGIIVNNGTERKRNINTLELASKFKEVKAALGFYPTGAVKLSDSGIDNEIELIRKNKDKISAIGEIGLDLKEEDSNLERQKEVLKKFLGVAEELDVPVIIHSRKAEEECIELLEKLKVKKIIMHCFSGNFKLVERIKDNNWCFSIPANITFSEHFQKLVKRIPIEQLFCETDSPYLHPIKGEHDNEPANVVESYKKIAEIKEISMEECERKIGENYNRLFIKKLNIKP